MLKGLTGKRKKRQVRLFAVASGTFFEQKKNTKKVMTMKLKQVLSVMLISGLTTVAVMYGYNKFNPRPITIQSANAQVPSNYVGLFDSNNNIPGQAVDFQAAALSTTPSVVHITTVIGKNQASNNLPRRSNPFADLFGDDFFKDFDNQKRSVPQRAS
jgi:hypothetical protein